MATTCRVNFESVPISAIDADCLRNLSQQLNKKKQLKSQYGYERDWRGVYHSINLPNKTIEDFERAIDPLGDLLLAWKAAKPNQATTAIFQQILRNMDRYDVLDDNEFAMRKKCWRSLSV